MSSIMQTIIQSGIILVVSGLLSWLVKKFTDRFSPDQVKIGADIARIAVKAAEQVGEKESLTPEQKRELALKYFLSLTDKRGIYFSETQIEALLEHAVFELG